ncbi:MAG TPA: hypothetical protein VNJ08_11930 [Bacteriovoracaceae bacterium]|nr:hypothetical protein [Bacteriovoracaceae bacterium]
MTFKATLLTFLFLMLAGQNARAADSKSLMVSPSDNTFFEIRDKPRYLHFVIRRPDPKLRYKLEIILNKRIVVDHFIDKDTFKFKVGRYDQEVKWRVLAYDEKEKLVISNYYAVVQIYHNQKSRNIDLKLDRHSLKDKFILTWPQQEECSAYNIVYNGKRIATTKRKGALLNDHADAQTIKVECLDDVSHFGIIDLKPKKILAHAFFYEFQGTGIWIKQELSGYSSNQNYIMQVHGMGYQFHWDKRKRNDLMTFFRYGLPLDFSDKVRQISFEARMRFDFISTIKEKLLLEFESPSLTHDFDSNFTSEQTMTFLSAGLETYLNLNNKIFKGAFLLKKEIQSLSSSPSFKIRLTLPYSKNILLNAEFDYSRFTSDETENYLKQVKTGLTYLF